MSETIEPENTDDAAVEGDVAEPDVDEEATPADQLAERLAERAEDDPATGDEIVVEEGDVAEPDDDQVG